MYGKLGPPSAPFVIRHYVKEMYRRKEQIGMYGPRPIWAVYNIDITVGLNWGKRNIFPKPNPPAAYTRESERGLC